MVKSYVRREPLELPMYRGPGKFEGELRVAEFVWDLTMEGFGDGGLGDVEGFGYYEVVSLGPEAVDDIARQAKEQGVELTADERQFIKETAGAIVREDNVGFVDVEWYDTQEQLQKAWGKIEWQYEQFMTAGYGQQTLNIEED